MKDFLKRLLDSNSIKRVSKSLSTNLEISAVLYALQDQPILFEKVMDSSLKLAGNLYPSKEKLSFALALDSKDDLMNFIKKAVDSPSVHEGRVSNFDKSNWDYNMEGDLTKIPILKHYDKEAGSYVTAGIVATKFPGTDVENLSFHRMLVLSKNRLAVRIVPRHLDHIAREKREKVPVSILIGPPPAVFLAASLQTQYGTSEYRIANKMMDEKLELMSSELTDISVPIDSEILLEGYLDYQDIAKEGPFVDLTGTYDEIREQPVVTIQRMHYKNDSVYQSVLAGSREHSLFMGIPQELKIRDALSKSVPKIHGINLTTSSNGYFHCVVSIDKYNDGDGKTAILNCFAASHPLKAVIVVDGDVNPFDLGQVEWALATRFQSDRGLVQFEGAKGSSLDPSNGKSAITSKLGIDATLPIKGDRSKFERATIRSSEVASSVINALRQA